MNKRQAIEKLEQEAIQGEFTEIDIEVAISIIEQIDSLGDSGMKQPVKYIQSVYLPKCDHCGSNIVPPEKHYFAAIEGHDQSDVRIVHRECWARNQTYWAREEYEEDGAE